MSKTTTQERTLLDGLHLEKITPALLERMHHVLREIEDITDDVMREHNEPFVNDDDSEIGMSYYVNDDRHKQALTAVTLLMARCLADVLPALYRRTSSSLFYLPDDDIIEAMTTYINTMKASASND